MKRRKTSRKDKPQQHITETHECLQHTIKRDNNLLSNSNRYKLHTWGYLVSGIISYTHTHTHTKFYLFIHSLAIGIRSVKEMGKDMCVVCIHGKTAIQKWFFLTPFLSFLFFGIYSRVHMNIILRIRPIHRKKKKIKIKNWLYRMSIPFFCCWWWWWWYCCCHSKHGLRQNISLENVCNVMFNKRTTSKNEEGWRCMTTAS